MSTPRTLILGIDGATFDLIEPWARAGHLPNLSRLMAEGVHGPLRAWPNMNSAAAWTSMVTGYNPGQHNIYGFSDPVPRVGLAWHPTTALDRKKDPFWLLLSAAGQQVGILNVPISYPADPVNGFMLSGMDAPGIHSPGFSQPPGLLDELAQEGIEYVLDVSGKLAFQSHRDPCTLPASVPEMVEARTRAVLHLMRTRSWDVLMAVLIATDRVQHHFWPAAGTSLDAPEWAPIRTVYQLVDSFLGQLLQRIDENTTVLVVSDHGFGPRPRAPYALNRLFARVGLLGGRPGQARRSSQCLRNLFLFGRQVIPLRVQEALIQAMPGLHTRAVTEHRYWGLDWSRTRVFASRYGGSVYVNLQGRQPEGIVAPEDVDSLLERVRDVVSNLTDPATGRQLVRGVYRREDLYHGPYLDDAGDLVIEWDREALGDALCYQSEGTPIIVEAPERGGAEGRWTGTHCHHGVFIARGPYIKPGGVVETPCLYDVAPTILYLQDHPVPNDMDGRVLAEIFAGGRLERKPVRWMEPISSAIGADLPALDAGEARQVEDRLRGLGYID